MLLTCGATGVELTGNSLSRCARQRTLAAVLRQGSGGGCEGDGLSEGPELADVLRARRLVSRRVG
jgi:hypothetical protein